MNGNVEKQNRDVVDHIGDVRDQSTEPTIAVQSSAPPEDKPVRNAISAAALKLERNRDSNQAMKEHLVAKQQTLAKTARLRAERLAREAKAASEAKLPAAKKK